MALYMGLMSGTSADGLDLVLADFRADAPVKIVAAGETPWTPADRKLINALCVPGDDEIRRARLFGNRYAEAAAGAVLGMLRENGLRPADVRAVASHGQTVRHEPALGFTVQLGNHALLAALTGIDVVCDFRAADITLGGQGAPLVPAFHREILGDPAVPRFIVNVGGIANVTALIPGRETTGFDTGPGNTLMDLTAAAAFGEPSDLNGRRAAAGRVSAEALRELADDPYFAKAPPKSTGRELFNAGYLAARPAFARLAPEDKLATLAEFTALTVIAGVDLFGIPGEIYVCGGGCRNAFLMARLGARAAASGHRRLASVSALGVDPDFLEALAFAWLGYKFVNREPVDLRPVTGASRPAVLGALYPRP